MDGKLAGILVETVWNGHDLEATVLGIGINVLAGVRSAPDERSLSCDQRGRRAEGAPKSHRADLAGNTVGHPVGGEPECESDEFIAAWEKRLAFRGEHVRLARRASRNLEGRLAGLWTATEACCWLARETAMSCAIGELHLRPSDDRIG